MLLAAAQPASATATPLPPCAQRARRRRPDLKQARRLDARRGATPLVVPRPAAKEPKAKPARKANAPPVEKPADETRDPEAEKPKLGELNEGVEALPR